MFKEDQNLLIRWMTTLFVEQTLANPAGLLRRLIVGYSTKRFVIKWLGHWLIIVNKSLICSHTKWLELNYWRLSPPPIPPPGILKIQNNVKIAPLPTLTSPLIQVFVFYWNTPPPSSQMLKICIPGRMVFFNSKNQYVISQPFLGI